MDKSVLALYDLVSEFTAYVSDNENVVLEYFNEYMLLAINCGLHHPKGDVRIEELLQLADEMNIFRLIVDAFMLGTIYGANPEKYNDMVQRFKQATATNKEGENK